MVSTMEQSMSQTIDQRISQLQHDLALAKSDIRYYQDYIDRLEAWYAQPWYFRLFNKRNF